MERNQSSSQVRIPNGWNAGIVAAQSLAFAGCIYAACRTSTHWQTAAVALLFGVIMNSIYSTIHEAEHAMLFSNPGLNDAAGMALALFFPAPFHLLRQGHIGHHIRNRSDDEAFDLYFEGDSVIWKWLVWIGILTGLYYLLVVISNLLAVVAPFIFDRKHFKVERHVAVDRASGAFLESFNPKYLRWIWLEGFSAILLHVGIILGFRIPFLHYLILYAAFGFMWSAMQYVHHYATERHVTRGARNLFLLWPIDAIWLNHNWHRTHHEHPTVPWIYLPAVARAKDQLHRGFLPLAYLKMWRGPRKTGEHVQNKYPGRTIQ